MAKDRKKNWPKLTPPRGDQQNDNGKVIGDHVYRYSHTKGWSRSKLASRQQNPKLQQLPKPPELPIPRDDFHSIGLQWVSDRA